MMAAAGTHTTITVSTQYHSNSGGRSIDKWGGSTSLSKMQEVVMAVDAKRGCFFSTQYRNLIYRVLGV